MPRPPASQPPQAVRQKEEGFAKGSFPLCRAAYEHSRWHLGGQRAAGYLSLKGVEVRSGQRPCFEATSLASPRLCDRCLQASAKTCQAPGLAGWGGLPHPSEAPDGRLPWL